MLTVILPREQTAIILSALTKAKHREVGGILMGEHIGPNEFVIRDITVHRRCSFRSFLRRIEDALGQLHAFFQKTEHNYLRFNYIGEWHSHPLFKPVPSWKDDVSMLEIIQDDSVGANFVVLLIVKMDVSGKLIATANAYFPNGVRSSSHVKVEY